MACINMQLGADRQALRGVPAAGQPPPISPRVSFSSDFAVETPAVAGGAQRSPPADQNFEFAVGGESATIDADQLFFKGRLLPLKESGQKQQQQQRGATTLREELLLSPAGGNDEWPVRSLRGSAIKWKELLGLKKPHCSFAAVPLPTPAPAKKQNDKPTQPQVYSPTPSDSDSTPSLNFAFVRLHESRNTNTAAAAASCSRSCS